MSSFPRSPDISAAFFDRLRGARDALFPERVIAWFSRPSSVWWGFAVVHLYYLGWMASFFLNGWAFSDTEQYREWAMAGFSTDVAEQSISPWVYPVLAQIPIHLAGIAGHDLYLLAWTLIITALNALAIWFLTRRSSGGRGVAPAWWLLIFLVFMGYLSFARVEGIAAPIVLIGMLYAARQPVVASVLLSIATWIKVWPAAVILSLLIAAKKRVRVFLAGVAVTAVVVFGTWLSGGLTHIADFMTNQGSRGMQLEATFSTPWVWLSVLNIADSKIADNTAINSSEVYGPGTEVAAHLMQPLLIIAVVLGAALLIRSLRRGAERGELFYEGALMMTTVLIVFNKVGSPQFMIWLAPVIVAGLFYDWERWRTPAALLMGIAVVTFFIYPLFYTPLIHAHPIMAVVLTIRNILLVLLLAWSVKRTWDLGAETRPAHEVARG